MKKTVDIICAGEILIDFIGHELNASINSTQNYQRFLGGSPTNVAMNAAKLGLQSVLVATCGQDGLGDFMLQKLKENKVITSHVKKSTAHATSIILISKSTSTPDFIPYRDADFQIDESQITTELLESAKIFHTTCFALSKNPAQTTLVESAKKAKKLGLQTSIDLNFSERIWHNRAEAKNVISGYFSTNPLVKLSEDDCYRFFGDHKTEAFIFDYFHDLGASTICFTKGKDGVVLSNKNIGIVRKEALPLKDIKDATGAGDAFWTGFLYAQLMLKDAEQSIHIAQKLAVLKLQNLGGLPENMNILEYLNSK
jgi:fructokinase